MCCGGSLARSRSTHTNAHNRLLGSFPERRQRALEVLASDVRLQEIEIKRVPAHGSHGEFFDFWLPSSCADFYQRDRAAIAPIEGIWLRRAGHEHAPVVFQQPTVPVPKTQKVELRPRSGVPRNWKIIILAKTRNVRAAVRDADLDFLFRQLLRQLNKSEARVNRGFLLLERRCENKSAVQLRELCLSKHPHGLGSVVEARAVPD